MAIELCGQETSEIEAEFKVIAEQALLNLEKANRPKVQTGIDRPAARRQTDSSAKPQSEKEIQLSIIKWLKSKRIFCYRQNNQGRLRRVDAESWKMLGSETPGIPDIGGVLPDGRALYIEVKSAKWRPPSEEAIERAYRKAMHNGKKDPYETYKHQREFQRRARESGAIVILARSLADVENHIRKYCDETWTTFSLD